jgi:hypothetical protein
MSLKKKTIELKREVPFSLDIIDAAVYRAIQDSGYYIGKEEDTLNVPGLFDNCRYAVREVLTLGSIMYHWMQKDKDGLEGLGGIVLRKKADKVTEIKLSPPINSELQKDSVQWSFTVMDRVKQEGYLPNGRFFINEEKGKPGRPTPPDDIWVIEQIRNGREPREIYKEWLDRPGVKVRDPQDPKRRFSALVKKVRQEEKEQTI